MSQGSKTKRQSAKGKKQKYRVTLPVMILGTVHEFGDVVELEDAVADEFSYALISAEEDEED